MIPRCVAATARSCLAEADATERQPARVALCCTHPSAPAAALTPAPIMVKHNNTLTYQALHPERQLASYYALAGRPNAVLTPSRRGAWCEREDFGHNEHLNFQLGTTEAPLAQIRAQAALAAGFNSARGGARDHVAAVTAPSQRLARVPLY